MRLNRGVLITYSANCCAEGRAPVKFLDIIGQLVFAEFCCGAKSLREGVLERLDDV